MIVILLQCSFTCPRQSDKCCILTEPTMKAECCCKLTRLYQACMNRNIQATTATSVTDNLQLKSVFLFTHQQYIHHLNNTLKHQSERSNQTIWVKTPVWTQHGWGGHIKPPQLNYYVTILLNVCPVTKSVVCQWCHKNRNYYPRQQTQESDAGQGAQQTQRHTSWQKNNNCAVCMWQGFHVNTDMRLTQHTFHKKQLVGYMHRIRVVANFHAITKF